MAGRVGWLRRGGWRGWGCRGPKTFRRCEKEGKQNLILAFAFANWPDWPHAGVVGKLERSGVFFLAAAITRATITDQRSRWQITGFALLAILVEVGRKILGRDNGLGGWLTSTAGAALGAVLMRHIAHDYFWKWGW